MDPQRDQDCLRRIQARDEQALAELYDRYTPLLFPVAVRILGVSAEAEDAFQAAWLQVWKRPGSFDPRRGALVGWLAAIVRAHALDLRRHLGARAGAAGPGSAGSGAGRTPAPAANTAGGERAREALAQLEPAQRDVIQLAYFEGMSVSEIAVRMGSGPEDVRAWTRTGLVQLRDHLPQVGWP